MGKKEKKPKVEPAETVEEGQRRFGKVCGAQTFNNTLLIQYGFDHQEYKTIMNERVSAKGFNALVQTTATLYPDVVSCKHMTCWGLKLGDQLVELIEPLIVKPAFAVPLLPVGPVRGQELMRLDVLQEGVGCEMFGRYLMGNTFLKHLTLDYNPIGDAGCLKLCEGLGKHEGSGCLEVLSMVDCGIGAKGVEGLGQLFLNIKCILTTLNIKGNFEAGMAAVTKLLQGVRQSSMLEGRMSPTIGSVNLHDTFKACDKEIEPEFSKALAEVLDQHPTLWELILTGNAVSLEDGKVVLEAVRSNRMLASVAVDRDLGEIFDEVNTSTASNMAYRLKTLKKGAGKKKKK